MRPENLLYAGVNVVNIIAEALTTTYFTHETSELIPQQVFQ